MTHIIHVGGAKGVGKTTILSEIHGSASLMGYKVFTVHMSQMLQNLSYQKYNTKLTELTKSTRIDLRKEAASILTEANIPIILLDSHAIDMENGEPKTILPPEFEKIIDNYIVITADINTIRNRRIEDLDFRKRDLDLTNIKKEVESEIFAAAQFAANKGCEMAIVTNMWKNDAKNDILSVVDRFMEIDNLSKEGGQKSNENIFRNI